MPINIANTNGITRKHTAERLQINLLSANEDVTKMQIEAYFNVSILLGDEELAKTWDSQPLIFNCADDEELQRAMEIIQSRIGQKRYEQITATLSATQ